MQLHQIQAIDRQIPQAVVNEGSEVRAIVSLRGLRRQPPSSLGSTDNLVFPVSLEPRNQLLAAPHSVDVGSVDKINPAINRPIQRRQRIRVIHTTPGPANCPGAKADLRNLPTSTSKCSIFHGKKMIAPISYACSD